MAEDSGELAREAQEASAANAISTQSAASDTNRKTLGEATAFYTAQAMSNSNQQQQQLWNLSNAITTKAVEKLLETTATEGAGPDVNALLALVKALQSVQPTVPTQT